ncbi:signal peptidase II [Pontiella sulfatireligans]|uniref:Lipoprotein signal peptidase n=1 Tax=Pontiella sulfatireligans TaxID=2750658 RepID=A0A6C2ULW5_9BACT|nr:signal peptidase II [Pontiella sulfatireligans]VGO20106.1 Lipoprotein signal peptidase [Pontiella sulfatireligans]
MTVLLIGLAILFLDQFTKQAVRAHFIYGESRPVIDGFFNLVYVRNDGAAWNMLSGHGIILILISAAVLVLLVVYRRSFLQEQFLHKILFGLMIGGIAGNLIDRIRFGWVTDFLDFQFGSYHYPSFNVADSAICIAVGLYILTNLLQKKEGEGDEELKDA